VAAAMLLGLRGTAFLYYGEEIGQRNIDVPNDQAFDSPARRNSFLFRWWNRDRCRGPIAWRPGPGGGFTTGAPWLPLTPDHEVRNVETQAEDPASILSWYRNLLELRRATPALHAGSFATLDVPDRDVWAFRRDATVGGDGAAGSAIVALNFASREAAVSFPPPRQGRAWRIALSTHPRGELSVAGSATLAPLEALILVDG
jgi:alpha-glucosidase